MGRRDRGDPVIRLEIYGLLVLAFGVALLLALISFDPDDVAAGGTTESSNLVGPVGAQVAALFLRGLGLGAFVLDGILLHLGLSYLVGRRWRLTVTDVLGWLGLLLAGVVMLHVALGPERFLGHAPGGGIGAWVGEVARAFLSTTGTSIVFVTLLVVSLVVVTRRSLFELALLVGRAGRAVGNGTAALMRHGDRELAAPRWLRWPRLRRRRDAAEAGGGAAEADAIREGGPSEAPPEEVAPSTGDASTAGTEEPEVPAVIEVAPEREAETGEPPPASGADEPARDAAEAPAGEERADEPIVHEPAAPAAPGEAAEAEAPAEGAAASPAGPEVGPSVEGPAEGGAAGAEEAPSASEPEASTEAPPPAPASEAEASSPEASPETPAEEDDDVRIVESQAMRRSRQQIVGDQLPLPGETASPEHFELPPLSLLDYEPPEGRTWDRERLRSNARLLEEKLADYKVEGRVVEIHPGPVVTMYEFKPAPGVKIATIAKLSDDLAMALSAFRVRIVAPIPGKDVVGIEVPNDTRETVWMKESLSDPSWAKAKSKVTMVLGKDIVGNPTAMDLSKAPHLLVAGATGSGKSVAINSFICSILYGSTPEDVRMILIDPKMLELSVYEGIAHLLLPVVTDPKQATTALRWAVQEMERRYRLMAELGVRNLDSYNKKVRELHEDPDAKLPEKLASARRERAERGEPDPEGAVLDTQGQPLEKLPYVVVVVDEFADLMMVAAKDVEFCIARLAQMARAAGIHLILATQRPSTDVISGVIKNNFPSRISFRLSSKTDSRTILDQNGAEALLGNGDMLWASPGSSMPRRVHGCFLSDDEVERIVEHVKAQREPSYDMGILATDEEGEGGGEESSEADNLYDKAVRIVAETRNASISFLQRKLKIGYNRSARIVEQMEEEGVVGPSDGTSRPREVYVNPP